MWRTLADCLLIIVLMVSAASASVHLEGNLTTPDGEWSAYSEGKDHRLSASSVGGPSEYVIVLDLADALDSSAWHGLEASEGASFGARTPEYSLSIRDARDFRGTVSLQRDSTIEEVERIITEKTDDSLVEITETVYTTANVETSVKGDGIFAEDVEITSASKARAMKIRELDGSGNFSLNTSMQIDGISTKRGFGRLNETEMFDRRSVMAVDPETGAGSLGGI